MLSRREFLESGCVLFSAAGATSLFGHSRVEASAATAPYRALVCIALGGGADSFNMLVPTDPLLYRNYKRRRRGLALNHDELLPLNRGDRDGRSYALHHGMRELHELYATGETTLLANAGPMRGPVGHPDRVNMPDLSHSGLIARWHHGTAGHRSNNGWAGRVADVLEGHFGSRSRLPINISMSGRNVMQLGACSVAANLQSSLYRQHPGSSVGIDFSYVNQQLAEQAISDGRPGSVWRKTRLLEKVETECRSIVEDTVADAPELETRFATDSFSSDLEKVARIIGARGKIRTRRQIFYLHFDGWDHHHQLLENQAVMLPVLSRGLADFRNALVEQDVFDDVTTFTTSEFGRSLVSNGSGSDHGWGGHHIIMGGAVQGGQIFGDYPDLAENNPLDIGGGSFVPTTSMDEYLAELSLWLGLPASDLPYVLPDVSKYWLASSQTPPLGILA